MCRSPRSVSKSIDLSDFYRKIVRKQSFSPSSKMAHLSSSPPQHPPPPIRTCDDRCVSENSNSALTVFDFLLELHVLGV